MERDTNKFMATLQSRKFWASILSVLVTVGLFKFSDAEQSQLVEAIVLIAPLIAGAVYSISTAVEDAAHAKVQSEVVAAQAEIEKSNVQMAQLRLQRLQSEAEVTKAQAQLEFVKAQAQIAQAAQMSVKQE